ncbi:MAG: shikimate dehydrogenase [Betaproteobacteria bacterium]|nr:shikimate dehydrogenase [Betaproteobacteria bacterium]
MTDLYAVVGNPVAHSRSPAIHAEFARATGQDLRYEALLAPFDGLARTLADFRGRGGKGCNVTVPFKLEAFRLAAQLSARAQVAEAVNTLKFDGDAVFGDNTDGVGLIRDIRQNLGWPIEGKRVLLMGAGGAAQGVLAPLLDEHPATLVIANRTPRKAEELAGHMRRIERFRSRLINAGPYPELKGKQFDIVINATSGSLSGELPPLPRGVFAAESLAYDMMYGQALTPFLGFAQAEGAGRLADGIGMLVEQAAESFFLWRGVRPDTAPVITLLKMQQETVNHKQ